MVKNPQSMGRARADCIVCGDALTVNLTSART